MAAVETAAVPTEAPAATAPPVASEAPTTIPANNKSSTRLQVQTPAVDTVPALKSATEAYAGYLNFSQLNDEETKTIIESVDSMLARMDELGTVIDSITTEHAAMRKEVLPHLQAKAEQLKRIFATVDKLQELIDLQKRSVAEMEDRVAAADSAASVISVQKIFSFFSKKQDEPDARLYKNVDIVNTKEWFDSARANSTSAKPTQATTPAK